MRRYLMIFFLMLLYLTSCNSCTQSDLMDDCKSVNTFIEELAKSKVEYERNRHIEDSTIVINKRERYYSNVSKLKIEKNHYRKCINHLLEEEGESNKDKRIVFSHTYMLSSKSVKCETLPYNEYLKVLLFNIKNLKDPDNELICW